MIDVSIVVSGQRITDMPNINVIRSLSDNNAVSSFQTELNNYAGYNTQKYQVGQDIQVYTRLNGSTSLGLFTVTNNGSSIIGSSVLGSSVFNDYSRTWTGTYTNLTGSILMSTGSLITGSTVTPGVYDSGLIAYYKLDETVGSVAIDSINGYNCLNNSGVIINASGIIGACYDFEWSSGANYIYSPTFPPFTYTQNLSMGAWINREGSGAGYQNIISTGNGTGKYLAELNSINGSIGFRTLSNAVGNVVQIVGAVTTIGSWYHAMATYNGTSKKMQLYLNGILQSSGTATVTAGSGAAGMFIGEGFYQAGPANGEWDGKIDDVRIFNYEVPIGSILSIYSSGAPSAYASGAAINTNNYSTWTDYSNVYNGSIIQTGSELIGSQLVNGSVLTNWDNTYGQMDLGYSGIIFNGIIEDVKFQGNGVNEKMQLTGKDYSCRLLDRNVEPEVYSSLTPGSIVKDIIAKYTNDITTTNVNIGGGSIAKIKFNQTPVFDAVKQLATFNDYVFYVDDQKDLHFEPALGSDTGYLFDNTNVLKADFKTQRDTVFNQVWVYGDRYLDAFKETKIGGSQTGNYGGSVYTLLYNPSNVQVTVSGAIIQPGGIYQMSSTAGSDVKYLVNYDAKQIIFTSGTSQGANIPASGNSVIFDYQRLLPIVKVGDDESSKAQYGTRVKSIVDKSIKDPNTATMIMKTNLAELSQPVREGNINVEGVTSIIPGRTCTINLPNHNVINQSYQVIEANYDINKEECLHDHILTIKLNKKLPDITDEIKNIKLQLKKLEAQDISDSDVITRFQMSVGSISIQPVIMNVYTRTIGSSFILGHPTNGLLGSYATHSLGDWRTALVKVWSGAV